jgi:hypothetical protein
MAGGAIAALLVGLLVFPSLLPPAIADEEPAKALLSSMDELLPPRFDPDSLAKYDFTVEPGVSEAVIDTRTVRKIGYGRTQFVEIVTTPSGVYSSDGLASPYIRYPGIHKQWKGIPHGRLALWTKGKGWTAYNEVSAGSFVSISAFEGGELLTTEDGSCVLFDRAAYC